MSGAILAASWPIPGRAGSTQCHLRRVLGSPGLAGRPPKVKGCGPRGRSRAGTTQTILAAARLTSTGATPQVTRVTGGYTTGYQRWANTAPGTTRHCVFERDWQSAVVQWLGYLAFTQETRVQTPAAEPLYVSYPGAQTRSPKLSPAGNRTRVTRVTGGYTNLYTTEDSEDLLFIPQSPLGAAAA